jgi:hypothetical protein
LAPLCRINSGSLEQVLGAGYRFVPALKPGSGGTIPRARSSLWAPAPAGVMRFGHPAASECLRSGRQLNGYLLASANRSNRGARTVTESGAQHRLCMASQREQHLTTYCIPRPSHLVERGGYDALAVRAEADAEIAIVPAAPSRQMFPLAFNLATLARYLKKYRPYLESILSRNSPGRVC